MKFICTQENLKRGLGIVSYLAGKNQTLPILKNVLLEIKNNILVLSTTNLEMGVKSIVRGKTEGEGSLSVPARLLYEFINNVNSEKVELIQDGFNLKIETPNTQTTIKGFDPAEFPLIPTVEKEQEYSLPANLFKQAIASVIFAVAMDNTRPEISGVLLDFKKDKLILATTDSYRLAEKTIKIDNKDNSEKKVIIPAFTLQELNRILAESKTEGEIKIVFNQNQVLFEIDSTILVSRLIEGEYPDYQQVIPQNVKTKAIVEVGEFSKGVKIASFFCRQGINDIHLQLKDQQLIISALNDQVGENTTTINTEQKGDNNEIVFNYHYVLDGLNNIASDKVEVGINSNALPGVFRPVGDDSYVYIIMPIEHPIEQ